MLRCSKLWGRPPKSAADRRLLRIGRVLAYHADAHALQLPAGHRFPAEKYRLLRESVARTLPEVRLEPAAAASDGELALAHSPGWIEAVVHGTLGAAREREIGFPWSEAMVRRSRHSVGATVQAARAALLGGEGVAMNLAGGTHHAHIDRGAGFCVFNDVAVAARLMQAEWHRRRGPAAGLLRVLVVDLDVHQGDGTASIFADDDSVFTLSLHGGRNFPVRKARSDLDIELPDGCDDATYLDALDAALATAFARLPAPGLAFYLAGADAHEGDRLGRLKLSAAGLAERDRRVLQALGARRVPVALAMAGGYGRDMMQMVGVQCRTVELALQAWRGWRSPVPVADAAATAPAAQAVEQCPR